MLPHLLVDVLNRQLAHKVAERPGLVLAAVLDHLRVHRDVERECCGAFLVVHFVRSSEAQRDVDSLPFIATSASARRSRSSA